MNTRARLRTLALASLTLLFAWRGDGRADEPEARVLFDGESLAGWKKTDFYRPGEVAVEDGAIVMKASPAMAGMTGVTCTRTDLPTTDYELRYEATRLDGSDFFAAATFPVGKSHVTLVNGGWGGHVTGISSVDGADASENETSTAYTYRNRTWYRFRVRVTGKTIRCWIDDKEVVDLDHEGRQLRTRLETRSNEPLGFATWQTSGAVRGISIRRLTPEEVAETDADDAAKADAPGDRP